jgi:hypothetical protein
VIFHNAGHENMERQMKKNPKRKYKEKSIFTILMFGTAILASANSYAAKVCVSDYIAGVIDGTYRNWYCHTSQYWVPKMAPDTTNHGTGDFCFCFIGGWALIDVDYIDYTSSRDCKSHCAGWCGV